MAIEEWGVKFEILYGLGDVTYEIDEAWGKSPASDGVLAAKVYTTLGDNAVTSDGHASFMDNPLAIIRRIEKNEPLSEGWKSGITIGNYQYLFSPIQSYDGVDKTEQVQQYVATTLLWSAVHTLMPV